MSMSRYEKHMTKAAHDAAHRKPTHFANGVKRPHVRPTQGMLDELVAKWSGNVPKNG